MNLQPFATRFRPFNQLAPTAPPGGAGRGAPLTGPGRVLRASPGVESHLKSSGQTVAQRLVYTSFGQRPRIVRVWRARLAVISETRNRHQDSIESILLPQESAP